MALVMSTSSALSRARRLPAAVARLRVVKARE